MSTANASSSITFGTAATTNVIATPMRAAQIATVHTSGVTRGSATLQRSFDGRAGAEPCIPSAREHVDARTTDGGVEHAPDVLRIAGVGARAVRDDVAIHRDRQRLGREQL